MSPPLIRCRGLSVGHGRPILPPIELSLAPGEFWAVVGRNGAGKTTLFRTLLGLAPALGGAVERAPGLRVSYLPQRAAYDDLYPVRARDVVAMAMDRGWSFLSPRWRTPPEAEQALAEVSAEALGPRFFRWLSEGQKQRVLLARLVAGRAQLAVLDEPTAAMDQVAEREAFELLDALRRRHGLTVLVVSHFLGVVRQFADRALLLDRDDGVVVCGTPAEVLGHESFRRRYGEGPDGHHG